MTNAGADQQLFQAYKARTGRKHTVGASYGEGLGKFKAEPLCSSSHDINPVFDLSFHLSAEYKQRCEGRYQGVSRRKCSPRWRALARGSSMRDSVWPGSRRYPSSFGSRLVRKPW